MNEDYIFEITILSNIINRWKTNNQDAALNKIESMVGKIKFIFHDKKRNLKLLISNYDDYQTLIEQYYEVKDNESKFIQKGTNYN